MKKKLFAILLSFAMVVTMMPATALTAFAEDGDPATENNLSQTVDEGKPAAVGLTFSKHKKGSKNLNENATELNGEYTVTDRVEIINNRLEVVSEAIINLKSGCLLRIPRGIHVTNNCSLTINGNGALIIDGVPYGCAGIGGNIGENGGDVTITGGIVTIVGGGSTSGSEYIGGGAGIGGGNKGNGGVVTITGGTVTATGGGEYGGAGIGGGNEGNGGVVTITGGRVMATGGHSASGIGGGDRGAGGTVTIKEGIVTATGGRNGSGIGSGSIWGKGRDPGISSGTVEIIDGIVTARGTHYGAGIGGGGRGNGATVTISGGNVTAIGGSDGIDAGGAGIGGGAGYPDSNMGNGGTVTISNGIVTATGGQGAAGIGGGTAGAGGKLEVNGGIVTATGGKTAIGKGYRCPTDKGFDDSFSIKEETLKAFDISNAGTATPINDPNTNVPNKIKRVLIRKSANIATEPTVVSHPQIYTGQEQNGYTAEGHGVQIAGRASAKDVGIYTFTAVPCEGYVWEDYTNDPKVYIWSIRRADYTNVTKEISANVEAKRGRAYLIELPIPEGARYGIPQKKVFNDPYMLSDIDEGNIILTITRTTTKTMVFTVPVFPDRNHNGYTITVTLTPISGGSGNVGGSDANLVKPYIPSPATPVTPADPATPVTPVTPADPATPVTPVTPTDPTPDTPDEPEVKPVVVSTTSIKGLTSYKKALKVTWVAKKNAAGYVIQYSTNKNFKNAKKVVVTNAKAKKITKLKAKTKYYVRIRCYNENENGTKKYSKWSATKSAKTK